MDTVPQEASQGAGASVSPGAAKVEELRPSRLRLALRNARVEEAEHSEALAELRGAELARLEMLQEELRPVLADVPDDIDIFDMGLMPGERPRLFIDMIGFVEMGRDRHAYRFMQDTRHGRTLIVESERIAVLVDAVTKYVARRLIEREKALASDMEAQRAIPQHGDVRAALLRTRKKTESELAAPQPRLFARGFGFTVDVLGLAALFTFLGIGIWTVLLNLSAWLSTHH